MKEITIYCNVDNGTATKLPEIERTIAGFDGRIEVTIREYRKRKSIPQRGYYFVCIATACQQGVKDTWGEHISLLEAHSLLKVNCNAKELVNKDSGEFIRIPLSTERMPRGEVEEYYERCRMWIKKYFNIEVPLPNEQTEIFK